MDRLTNFARSLRRHCSLIAHALVEAFDRSRGGLRLSKVVPRLTLRLLECCAAILRILNTYLFVRAMKLSGGVGCAPRQSTRRNFL